jgi:hypothetical protein
MVAIRAFETSVELSRNTRLCIPVDRTQHAVNFKSAEDTCTQFCSLVTRNESVLRFLLLVILRAVQYYFHLQIMSWKHYASLLTFCSYRTVRLFFSLSSIAPQFPVVVRNTWRQFSSQNTTKQMWPKPKQYIIQVHKFAVGWDIHLQHTVPCMIGTLHRVQQSV